MKYLIIVFVLMSSVCMANSVYPEKFDTLLIPYVDTMAGLAYAFKTQHGGTFEDYLRDTARVFFGFGIRPFLFLKIDCEALKGLGFGFNTLIFSSGLHIYYSHKRMKRFFLAWLVSWDWDGRFMLGSSFGVRF